MEDFDFEYDFDFGEGGAFPEILMAQFPLEMDKKNSKSGPDILALRVDSEGNVGFDAVVRQQGNETKIVYSQHKDLEPGITKDGFDESNVEEEDRQREIEETMLGTKAVVDDIVNVTRPKSVSKFVKYQHKDLEPGITKDGFDESDVDEEDSRKEIEETMLATKAVVDDIVNANVTRPKSVSKFVKYQPSGQSAAFNSGAKERVIRMVGMKVKKTRDRDRGISKKVGNKQLERIRNTKRFEPYRPFTGTFTGSFTGSSEKNGPRLGLNEEADPFGLDQW